MKEVFPRNIERETFCLTQAIYELLCLRLVAVHHIIKRKNSCSAYVPRPWAHRQISTQIFFYIGRARKLINILLQNFISCMTTYYSFNIHLDCVNITSV